MQNLLTYIGKNAHRSWLRCNVFLFVAKSLFVDVSHRMIRRTPRAMAASQDSRFCSRNSWRGNRCRKRWQSSYEKGISHVLCFPFSHTTSLSYQENLVNILNLQKRFPLFCTLSRASPCYTRLTSTWKESDFIKAVWQWNSLLPSQDKDWRGVR